MPFSILFLVVEAALLPWKQVRSTSLLHITSVSDLLPEDGDGAQHLNTPWARHPSLMQRCPLGVLQQREDPLLSLVTLQ